MYEKIQDRFNMIKVDLIPDFQYKQTELYANTGNANEQKVLRDVKLTPRQIKTLDIRKSYQTHDTQIILELTEMDPTVAALIGEGKYIIYLYVTGHGSEKMASQVGYFHPLNYRSGKSWTIGTQFVTEFSVELRSILSKRLHLENNLTVELGGKSGKGAAGAGERPLKFFRNELKKMYYQNHGYDDKPSDDSSDQRAVGNSRGDSLFDLTFSELMDETHIVQNSPSTGYKIEVNNNYEALDFFFDHYPLFKTDYGWFIDDFSMTSIYPSVLRVSDFVWWPAWRPHINQDLSRILNKELPTDKISKALATYGAFHEIGAQAINNVSYYELSRYLIREKYPKIFATDVTTGQVIDMSAWNKNHEERLVLVNISGDSTALKLKKIDNPMYREYLTFMNATEIAQTQLYKTVFGTLHPEVVTYQFHNMLIGDIDMNTIIELKTKAMSPATHYGKDRIGMAYQLRNIFTRLPLKSKHEAGENTGDAFNPESSQFMPRFGLQTTVDFLMVDQGPLDLPTSGNETHSQNAGEIFGSDSTGLSASECYDEFGGTYGDGGLPGNTSIADQAQVIFDTHPRYGHNTSDRVMDCSAFTQKAVKRAGIKTYPRSTALQYPWCRSHATLIKYEDMQRGDILFWDWAKGANGPVSHTGVAVDSTSFIHMANHDKNGEHRTVKTYKMPKFIFRLPDPKKPQDSDKSKKE